MMQLTDPVLAADRPNPDAIRVGDDRCLVASGSGGAPRFPIVHSKDLVSRQIVTISSRELPPVEHCAVPRHGCAVRATSRRLESDLSCAKIGMSAGAPIGAGGQCSGDGQGGAVFGAVELAI